MCNKEKVVGFVAGLGCGVGIALLWAPKSGSETRSLIANQAREQTEHIKQQATELRDSAAGILQKGQQEVQRHKEGLKRAVEAGVEAYQAPAA